MRAPRAAAPQSRARRRRSRQHPPARGGRAARGEPRPRRGGRSIAATRRGTSGARAATPRPADPARRGVPPAAHDRGPPSRRRGKPRASRRPQPAPLPRAGLAPRPPSFTQPSRPRGQSGRGDEPPALASAWGLGVYPGTACCSRRSAQADVAAAYAELQPAEPPGRKDVPRPVHDPDVVVHGRRDAFALVDQLFLQLLTGAQSGEHDRRCPRLARSPRAGSSGAPGRRCAPGYPFRGDRWHPPRRRRTPPG